MANVINISIIGAGGRMGHALVQALACASDLRLVGALEASQSPLLNKDAGTVAGMPETGVLITDDWQKVALPADVLIDFTTPAATTVHADAAANMGKPLVIGTTGLSQSESVLLYQAAAKIPIVWAPNMSVGVNLLFALTAQVAGILREYDIEIIEMHHRHKKDAPSGTALRLAENAATARRQHMDATVVHGRHGALATRQPGQIGMHALRGGDVVGDHTVVFAGGGERVELTHRATSRECLAAGALRAARWIVKREPGMYNMQNVLALSLPEHK